MRLKLVSPGILSIQFTLALVAALMPVAPGPAQAQTPALAGVIADVSGPVLWHPAAQTTFVAAHGGEQLFTGAIVRTGPHGFAHLQWHNGGDFQLYALSELIVPADESVSLTAGSIWAKFTHKLFVPFSFQSPTATAVVRGTTLGVELDPTGATRVAVIEGHVEVSGATSRGSVMLAPGDTVTVSPVGALGPIQPVTPHDRDFGNRWSFSTRPLPGANPGHPGGPPPAPGGPGGPPGPQSVSGGPHGGQGTHGSMLAWIRQFRAADRLDQVRQQAFNHAGGPPHGLPRPAAGPSGMGPTIRQPGGFGAAGQPGGAAPTGWPNSAPDRPAFPLFGAPETADPGQSLPDGRPPTSGHDGIAPASR